MSALDNLKGKRGHMVLLLVCLIRDRRLVCVPLTVKLDKVVSWRSRNDHVLDISLSFGVFPSSFCFPRYCRLSHRLFKIDRALALRSILLREGDRG